jgi:hypothetical protein
MTTQQAVLNLEQILDLVGPLDDTPGENTPREHFRRYLANSVQTIGAVRDYLETCLRTSGTPYNRALQDLVSHTGWLIGFEVEFGRYQGVRGEIGHDGLWHAGDLVIVVEVRTTDAYTFKTATLTGYIDQLISAQRIADWNHALGLYIVGRPDAGLMQLQHTIVAEHRMQQLRIATVENILSLAELVQDGHISQVEAVFLLRPTGVMVDETVQLLARVAAKSSQAPVEEPPGGEDPPIVPSPQPPTVSENRLYLLTAVASDEVESAQEVITKLLQAGWYVFGERTPGRKRLKPRDLLCFYETGVGVVAEAEVTSEPERRTLPNVRHAERFPWAFQAKNPRYFFDKPIVIDAALRSQLDAFKDCDPSGSWGWFVQATRLITAHDFRLLTGQAESTA